MNRPTLATPGWCTSCLRWCPGRDAQGFCLEVDWSEPRFAKALTAASESPDDAQPAPSASASAEELRATHVHRHQADFRSWQVLLEGVPVDMDRVWFAFAGAADAGWARRGSVQYQDQNGVRVPSDWGNVEIRAARACALEAVAAVATPVPEPTHRQGATMTRDRWDWDERDAWRWLVLLDGRPAAEALAQEPKTSTPDQPTRYRRWVLPRRADARKGEVEVVLPTPNGFLDVDLVDEDRAPVRTLRGVVEIRLRDGLTHPDELPQWGEDAPELVLGRAA